MQNDVCVYIYNNYAGTVFLWLFWPSFNAVLAEGDARYRTLINTYYSMTGSVISSFLLSILFSEKKKIDMVRSHAVSFC